MPQINRGKKYMILARARERWQGENGWLYGAAMLTVGAFTALIIFFTQIFWGA